jgi:hypothetical protein
MAQPIKRGLGFTSVFLSPKPSLLRSLASQPIDDPTTDQDSFISFLSSFFINFFSFWSMGGNERFNFFRLSTIILLMRRWASNLSSAGTIYQGAIFVLVFFIDEVSRSDLIHRIASARLAPPSATFVFLKGGCLCTYGSYIIINTAYIIHRLRNLLCVFSGPARKMTQMKKAAF